MVNVYSGEIYPANVAVSEGRIAYVGPAERPAAEVVDAAGLYLSPGWIEPHGHPWMLYNPVSQIEAILPGGTTLLFNDDLLFHLQAGPEGVRRALDALADLPLTYRWLIRLLSQSELSDETEVFAPESVLPLLDRPDVAGTAELTRWPQVLRGNASVLAGISRALALGKRADGHTAGASYEKLNAIGAGGISACHEAITAGEIADRLRLGFWTILRHSSLRPDLPELARAITEMRLDTRRLMLTMDGPSPRFVAENGFLDYALRELVARGVAPVTAIQMATINPATYYGMDQERGGIAPGRIADFVLLPDLETFRSARVVVAGRDVARDGRLLAHLPNVDWDALDLRPSFAPFPEGWNRPGGSLPVIELITNVITRGAGAAPWTSDGGVPDGMLLAVLLDRQGRWMTRAWLRGFAPRLSALASTYNSSGHLLVLGSDLRAMEHAAAAVVKCHGGIAFAEAEGVSWQFALPIAGMMSPLPFAETVRAQREIETRVQAAGFVYADICYALLFLAADFLPGWRLTPRGVLDVRSGALVEEAVQGRSTIGSGEKAIHG
ncbi:MAG TPA: adenine deaminase C-terminal domain-containing protein [Bryobacteraceae bacterium]|nr:adenine deaminase C-terminal domain-containing protein [Bryobacteraceae bacterium]